MRTAFRLFPILLLVACGEKDDDTGSDGFSPAEGTWVELSETVVSDECGFGDDDDDAGGAGSLQLTDDGGGVFTVQVANSDTGVFTAECTLSGQDFTCTGAEVAREDFAEAGLDAALVVRLDMDGSFSSSTALTVDLVLSADCEGDADDCTFVSDTIEVALPCEAVTRIEMEHAG